MSFVNESDKEKEYFDEVLREFNSINNTNDESTQKTKSELIEKLEKLISVPDYMTHRGRVLKLIRELKIEDLYPFILKFRWEEADSAMKTLSMCIAKSSDHRKIIDIFKKIDETPELNLKNLLTEQDQYGRSAIYFSIEDYHAYETFLFIKERYEEWGENIYDLRDKCDRSIYFYCLKFENYEGFINMMQNDEYNTFSHRDKYGNRAICEAVKMNRHRTIGLFLWLYYDDQTIINKNAQYMYKILSPNFQSIFQGKNNEIDLKEFKSQTRSLRNELNIKDDIFDIDDTYDKNMTLFFLACKVGSFDVAEVLVKFGCKTDVRDSEENTPLHVAMKGDFIQIIKFLIEDLKCDVKAQNNKGETPLMFACFGNKKRGIKYLIEKGIDFGIDLKDKKGRTAFDICKFRGKLTSLKALEWKKHQKEPSGQEEPSDEEKDKIFKKLIGRNENDIFELFNRKNLNFISPFCPATVLVLKGFMKIKEISNIDPNIKDIEGLTPLLTSIKKNKLEFFLELLEWDRVDKFVKDLNGDPFIILMTTVRHHKFNFRTKTFLQDDTPLNIIPRILPKIQYDELMQKGSKGETIFHHLCASKNKTDILHDIFKYRDRLELSPDDYNMPDKIGMTPLHYAVMNHNNEAVQFLLGIFNENTEKYLLPNQLKMTPIEIAVVYNNIPALKMLLFKKDFCKDNFLSRITKLDKSDEVNKVISDVAKETILDEKNFNNILNLMMKKIPKEKIVTVEINPIKKDEKRLSLEEKLNIINENSILKEKLEGISIDNFNEFLQKINIRLVFHRKDGLYTSVSGFEGYRKIDALEMLLTAEI